MKTSQSHVRHLRLVATVLILIVAGLVSSGVVAVADTGTTPPTNTTPPGARPAPIIYRPAGLSYAQKVPLVVPLYGSGCAQPPQCMEGLTHFEAVAQEHGFVVAYPGSALVGGTPWASSDDVQYIGSLIDQVTASQNIDPTRVYVVGFSAGGRFAYQLGCLLSSRLTAIAIVGSVQRPYACPLSHPVSELTLMGSQEAINGVPSRGIPSSFTVAGWWRLRDGCTGQVQDASQGPVSEQNWGPCVDGSTVSLYIVQGGNHTWPGCCGLPASDPDSQYNASEGIWSFFASHATGSLTQASAKLLAVRFAVLGGFRRRLLSSFDLGESVTVKQMLNAHGRTLASATTTLQPGAQVLIFGVPRKVKRGSYSLSLDVTDNYGRTLHVVRRVRVTKS